MDRWIDQYGKIAGLIDGWIERERGEREMDGWMDGWNRERERGMDGWID